MGARVLQTARSSIDSPKEAIEFGFIILLILLFGAFYFETTKIDPDAARVPQMLIYAGVMFSVLFLFVKIAGEKIHTIISSIDLLTSFTQEERTGETTDDDLKETFEDQQSSFKVSRSSIQYILLLFVYLLSLMYVGFFTTNFAFVFLYIVVENQDTLLKNIIIGAVVGLVNCYVLYWFVVELLEIGTVLRFGILI